MIASSLHSDISSSDSDSKCGGGALGASQWNLQRASRPIRPRSASTDGEVRRRDDRRFGHLLAKRRHRPVDDPALLSGSDEGFVEISDASEKSDLEEAVLMDCLSSHFLTSHLAEAEVNSLCRSFERRRYRDREIVYSRGDEGLYLYVVYSGEVRRLRRTVADDIDDETTTTRGSHELNDDGDGTDDGDRTTGDKYAVLGELAVLTGSSYRETVQAASKICTLFRLDRVALHRALRPVPVIDAEERAYLLGNAVPDEMIDLNYFIDDDFKRLASAMTAHSFEMGDVLVRKEERLDSLVLVARGSVVAKDVTLGGRSYDDQRFGPVAPNLSFGWRILLSSDARNRKPNFRGTVVARSDGVVLTLSKSSFRRVMKGHHGDDSTMLEQIAARRLARTELQRIPVFQDSSLDEMQINGLIDLMHRCDYIPDENHETVTIFKAGEKVEAALYFVREGAVVLETNKGEDRRIVQSGDYFGESNMLRDQNKNGKKHFIIRSPATATAHGSRTVVDILYLEECRAVVDTLLGLRNAVNFGENDPPIQLSEVQRHSLLGTGTFCQVWLASIPRPNVTIGILNKEEEEKKPTNDEPDIRIMALKVQSKHGVVQSEDAARVVAERNILASLKSPFLLQLFHAFQDENLLYMVTSVARGGELESFIPDDGVCEASAKFYAAGVLEGLSYMHRRHIIHRDIKPSNILINEKGYPVLIDFGFAKYVPDKTFTFVDSPMFTAPEIIRFQGHDRGSDNWAWAVLVYRLVTGKYPFYEDGIDELELYKRICKGTIELDGKMSVDFRMLMVSVLYPNPEQQLGSGRNGWCDIHNSSWLLNDVGLDIRKLRAQKMPAPWVPDLKDNLDASSFHPRDESEVEDLMRQSFPEVAERHQQIFASFGPYVVD